MSSERSWSNLVLCSERWSHYWLKSSRWIKLTICGFVKITTSSSKGHIQPIFILDMAGDTLLEKGCRGWIPDGCVVKGTSKISTFIPSRVWTNWFCCKTNHHSDQSHFENERGLTRQLVLFFICDTKLFLIETTF